jgi:hypothetical protein
LRCFFLNFVETLPVRAVFSVQYSPFPACLLPVLLRQTASAKKTAALFGAAAFADALFDGAYLEAAKAAAFTPAQTP